MKKLVKITTFQSILDLIYPCYCKGCGKIGEVFCSRCYFYNRRENPAFSRNLEPDFIRIFCTGLREGVLSKMISEYKFLARRQYASILSRMLVEVVGGEVPEDTLVVPLPTVAKHIRARGFDHTRLLADLLAEETGLEVAPILVRARNTVQVGSDDKKRRKQAREAYAINSEIKMDVRRPVLLLDDVWTTGASMRAASETLRRVGVEEIYGVVLAKNDGYEFS